MKINSTFRCDFLTKKAGYPLPLESFGIITFWTDLIVGDKLSDGL
jgi:hypothetical protein